MEDAHAKTVDEILNFFNTDPERGLTLDQIKRNQEKYGANGKLFEKIYCFIYFIS
jgi:P-type Ca2+ transporter type 2A